MSTMRLSIHLLSTAILLSLAAHVRAQQEVMVSQYMFDQLLINPAYAGSHPYASGALLHREQWLDMPGAPATSIAAFDAPLMGRKMGIGFTLVHDRIGISRDVEMAGHYAYKLRTGESGTLAFGLKMGLSLYSARFSDLTYWDANDAVYQGDLSNAVLGKFGAGLYWHDDISWIGLSVPTLYAADDAISSDMASAYDHYFTQHYYLFGGRVFDLSEDFILKPSLLIKYEPEAPLQGDVNLNVLYKERFWLGAGYRTGDALTGMVEYQIDPHLRVGYAYDATVSGLSNYSGGSHEIMLGIDLGKELVRIKSPRYF